MYNLLVKGHTGYPGIIIVVMKFMKSARSDAREFFPRVFFVFLFTQYGHLAKRSFTLSIVNAIKKKKKQLKTTKKLYTKL